MSEEIFKFALDGFFAYKDAVRKKYEIYFTKSKHAINDARPEARVIDVLEKILQLTGLSGPVFVCLKNII